MSKVASSGAGVDAAKASLRKKIEQVDVCVNKLFGVDDGHLAGV